MFRGASQPRSASPEPPTEPASLDRLEIPKPYDILPAGSVNIFAGASGTGKTALLAGWVRTWLAGEAWFGHQPLYQIPKVGMIVTDRRWERAMVWFGRAGVEESERFSVYCVQDDLHYKWGKLRDDKFHLELFREAVKRLGVMPRGSVVLLDPISPFLGGKLNDYSHTLAAIGPIQQEVAKLGLVCLGTHHTSKLKRDPKERHVRPQDRVLGSTALIGYTDTQSYVVGPEETDQPWYVVGHVPHDYPAKSYKMTRDERGLFKFLGDDPAVAEVTQEEQEVMAAGTGTMTQAVPDDRETQLLLLMIPTQGEVQSARWLQEARTVTGKSSATLRRRVEEFIKNRWVTKPKYGSYRRTVTLGSEVQA